METDDLGTAYPEQLLFRCDRESLRAVAATDNYDWDGRIPRAWITVSSMTPLKRSWFPPWVQLALGTHDNRHRFGVRGEKHHTMVREPFVLVRLWSKVETRRHFLAQSVYNVRCRFYRALLWRKGKGLRLVTVD